MISYEQKRRSTCIWFVEKDPNTQVDASGDIREDGIRSNIGAFSKHGGESGLCRVLQQPICSSTRGEYATHESILKSGI